MEDQYGTLDGVRSASGFSCRNNLCLIRVWPKTPFGLIMDYRLRTG
jgi:hypothetical protein